MTRRDFTVVANHAAVLEKGFQDFQSQHMVMRQI